MATEASGGGTPDLLCSPIVLGYVDIYRQKKYIRGATRGPRGWRARPGVCVVGLRLTVEWGVDMRRQDPRYGVVVHMSFYEFRPFSEEVTALRLGALRRSTGLCVCVFTKDVNPCPKGGGGLYRVR